jgi:hypothetical protein
MSKRMRRISPLAPAESTAMTLEDAEANVSDGTAFIVLNLARGQGTSFLSGESRMADGSFAFARGKFDRHEKPRGPRQEARDRRELI